MQELFWTLCSGSGGSLASNVSSEFAGNAGWFKTIQVFTKPWLFSDVFSLYLANSYLFWSLRRGRGGGKDWEGVCSCSLSGLKGDKGFKCDGQLWEKFCLQVFSFWYTTTCLKNWRYLYNKILLRDLGGRHYTTCPCTKSLKHHGSLVGRNHIISVCSCS